MPSERRSGGRAGGTAGFFGTRRAIRPRTLERDERPGQVLAEEIPEPLHERPLLRLNVLAELLRKLLEELALLRGE